MNLVQHLQGRFFKNVTFTYRHCGESLELDPHQSICPYIHTSAIPSHCFRLSPAPEFQGVVGDKLKSRLWFFLAQTGRILRLTLIKLISVSSLFPIPPPPKCFQTLRLRRMSFRAKRQVCCDNAQKLYSYSSWKKCKKSAKSDLVGIRSHTWSYRQQLGEFWPFDLL